jgi:hypothetical protein
MSTGGKFSILFTSDSIDKTQKINKRKTTVTRFWEIEMLHLLYFKSVLNTCFYAYELRVEVIAHCNIMLMFRVSDFALTRETS